MPHATAGHDAARHRKTGDVRRAGVGAHQEDGVAGGCELPRTVGIEGRAPDRNPAGSADPSDGRVVRLDQRDLDQRCKVDIGNTFERLLRRDELFVDEIDCDPERGARGALCRPCLQDPQFSVLDGEFDILDIAKLALEACEDMAEIGGERRQRAGDHLAAIRRSPARHDVLALRVEHQIDDGLRRSGRRVARKRNTRSRRRPAIAEDHGLHGDGRPRQMFEFLQPSIGLRPLAHPGSIDRPCRMLELFLGILEPAIVSALDQRLFLAGKTLERLAVERAIIGNAFLGGQRSDPRREECRVEAEYGLAIALEEPAPAIPCEPRASRRSDQAAHGARRAADIEDGVQHAGHRAGRT